MRMLATNCPNCGGVLEQGKCKYCNTEVRFANEIDIQQNNFSGNYVEISLNIKNGNETIIFPFVGRLQEMSMDYSSRYYYDDSALLPKVMTNNPDVRIVFEGTLKMQERVV